VFITQGVHKLLDKRVYILALQSANESETTKNVLFALNCMLGEEDDFNQENMATPPQNRMPMKIEKESEDSPSPESVIQSKLEKAKGFMKFAGAAVSKKAVKPTLDVDIVKEFSICGPLFSNCR
jgi:hypothetical protein